MPRDGNALWCHENCKHFGYISLVIHLLQSRVPREKSLKHRRTYCVVSSLAHFGKGLSMRVVVFSSLGRTMFHRRWLIIFTGASCLSSQNRFFINQFRGYLAPVLYSLQSKPSWLKFSKADNSMVWRPVAIQYIPTCSIPIFAMHEIASCNWDIFWCHIITKELSNIFDGGYIAGGIHHK